MSEQNKEVVRRFYAGISEGRLEIINELLAENFVEHEKLPGLEPNREGVRKMFEMFRRAFPDLRLRADDMVAEADKVFLRGTMTGTHKSEFLGIPPTGKTIVVPFGDFIRFEAGRVVEHWGVTDTGAMMEQLGQTGGPAAY